MTGSKNRYVRFPVGSKELGGYRKIQTKKKRDCKCIHCLVRFLITDAKSMQRIITTAYEQWSSAVASFSVSHDHSDGPWTGFMCAVCCSLTFAGESLTGHTVLRDRKLNTTGCLGAGAPCWDTHPPPCLVEEQQVLLPLVQSVSWHGLWICFFNIIVIVRVKQKGTFYGQNVNRFTWMMLILFIFESCKRRKWKKT